MDSIDFHAILSENMDKNCTLFLKNGEKVNGINRGVSNDNYGGLYARIENRGSFQLIKHTEVESININE